MNKNNILQQNLNYIKKHSTDESYKILQQAPFGKQITIEKQNNTQLYYGITPENKKVPLHSQRDPISEAKRKHKRWLNNYQYKSPQGVVVIILSMIAYYHAKQIWQWLEQDSTLIILEPMPDQFKTTLKNCQLPLIDNPKIDIRFVISEDYEEGFNEIKEILSEYPPNKIMYYANTAMNRCFPTYDTIFKNYEQKILLFCYNWVTSAASGRGWLNHTLRNLRTIFQESSIIHLKDYLVGKRAIIVAAGPTLDQTIPFLKKIEKKCVIIAISRAIKTLLHANIQPDFCMVVDGHPAVKQHFAKIPSEQLKQIHLIAPVNVSPVVISLFKDRIFGFSLSAEAINSCLQIFNIEYPILRSAGTVTVNALDAACYFGCTKLYAFGFDLCEKDDGSRYAEDADLSNKVYRLKAFVKVAGNWQPTVKTTSAFSRYIKWTSDFCKKIQEDMPNTTITNINYGGAKIDIMPAKKPEQIEWQTWQDLPNKKQTIKQHYKKTFNKIKKDNLQLLKKMQTELNELKTYCQQAVKLCQKILSYARDNKKYLKRLEKYEQNILQLPLASTMVQSGLQSGQLVKRPLETNNPEQQFTEIIQYSQRLYTQMHNEALRIIAILNLNATEN